MGRGYHLLLATAQDDAPTEAERIYQDVTIIDIEEELGIEAGIVKPTGVLTLERRQAQFNPLIQLRENFDLEMRESITQVR